MAHWEKRSLRLPADHGWSAKEGYNVFVADRGALRLDFPEDWITIPDKNSIRFHDRKPPDDRCFFEASYVRLRPIDWSGLPLAGLLQASCAAEGNPVTENQLVRVDRQDLELVWAQYQTTDPAEHRAALHRICIARTANAVLARPGRKGVLTRPMMQALITAAFWPEDAEWFAPIWEEVVRSLQLGTTVASPLGPARH